jgi:hypothetical protein
MQPVAFLLDVPRHALDGFGRPGGILTRQRGGVALDDRDRRLQLMRDDRHEGVLHLLEAGLLGQHVGGGAGLLQRTCRLASEHVENVHVAIRKAAGIRVAEDIDDADELLLVLQRQREHVIPPSPIAERRRHIQNAHLLTQLPEHVQDGAIQAWMQAGDGASRQTVTRPRDQAIALEQRDNPCAALQNLHRRHDDQL